MVRGKTAKTSRMLTIQNAKSQRNIEVCVDKRTTDNIESAKGYYKGILGRDVSTSVVMRRAVDLLARYLQQLHGEQWEREELSYLMQSIR